MRNDGGQRRAFHTHIKEENKHRIQYNVDHRADGHGNHTGLGKSLGGICADRFGTIRPSFLSLLAAACLFLFPSNIVTGIAAVLFFNMTMPITLTALYRLMPKHPGFSFGLLTFALFLGFLPVYLGIIPSRSSPVLYAFLSLISMFLLGVGLKGGDSSF